MSSIADKMKTRLRDTHGISSDDIEKLVAEQNQEEEAKPEPAAQPSPAPDTNAIDETSYVTPERPESHDSVLSTSVSELDSKNFFLGLLGALDSEGRIAVTPEDKSRFVDAVLSGGRMKLHFSFFGDKLSFTIKNRSYEEARAAMTLAVRDGGLGELNTLFTLRLRLMLMCMQVDEFNGVSYPDADKLGPVMPVYEDGKLVRPKWFDRVEFFGNLPEAIFEAVWQCIYEFEQKYWTLVRHSRDQDFWRPE